MKWPAFSVVTNFCFSFSNSALYLVYHYLLLADPFSLVGTTWFVSLMTGRMYGTLPPTWSTWNHIISSSTLVTSMLPLVLPSVRMTRRKGLTLLEYQVSSTHWLNGFWSHMLPHVVWSKGALLLRLLVMSIGADALKSSTLWISSPDPF